MILFDPQVIISNHFSQSFYFLVQSIIEGMILKRFCVAMKIDKKMKITQFRQLFKFELTRS